MRRPNVRIRLQLVSSVCLFTIMCLASLAAAIYTLSQSTLLDLQKGNLDLNCRMRRDESQQELQQTYDTLYRLAVSTPVRNVFDDPSNFPVLEQQSLLLNDSFGADRILMMRVYGSNGTAILQIDARGLNDSLLPSELVPLDAAANDSATLNKTMQEINQTAMMSGPLAVPGQPLVSVGFDNVSQPFLLSISVAVRSSSYSDLSSTSDTSDDLIGFVTGVFSGRKIQQVLSDASFSLATSRIGSAALCDVSSDWKRLVQLMPFREENRPRVANSSFPLPSGMAPALKDGRLPQAEVNHGPGKSMISVAPFSFLGKEYYVVALQDHKGVYAMPHSLRNMVFIASFTIAAGVVMFTFFFVSFGVRQIVKLKMATNYEQPAIQRWPWLPWWLRPVGNVQAVAADKDKLESRVPEKVPLRNHIKDEMNDITLRFNTMSDELARQYGVLEERVRLRKQEIELARRAANEANAAKSHFLARVTHELRTPLNGIIGTATLCLDEENIGQIHHSLRTIFKCGELLLHLMTDLLSFSQYEVESLELESREFMITEITTQLLAIFTEQCTAKGISLHVQASPATKNLVFCGDTNRILQVIFNLLSNGLKFTPSGGKVFFRVDISDDSSTVPAVAPDDLSMALPSPENSTESPEEPVSPGGSEEIDPPMTPSTHNVERGIKTVNFYVQDTGPGIAPHLQARIFEAFVQGDISTNIRRAGVGLGLSICRQLADRMNGSISLESTLGKGSTFKFSVPLYYARSQPEFGGGMSSPDATLWPECGEFPQSRQPGDVSRQPSHNSGRRALPLGSIETPGEACDLGPSDKNDSNPNNAGSSYDNGFDGHAQSTQQLWTSRPPLPTTQSYLERPPEHIRVLVVDDNKVNQEVMKRMLNLEGLLNIAVAFDGLDAIAKVKKAASDNEPFDVIFMDVQMPNMDGREATRVLRGELAFTAPIVAVSAFANDENAEDCLAAGMTLFMSKPLRRPHLRKILKTLEEMSQSTPASPAEVARLNS